MVRFVMKGGIWRNSEDEILKAAVMKYGTHQWARISSLLTRKTPKQCKARWFEWLDPNIRKTPFTRDEDMKLMQLVKSMPNQWRTIAPLVGRTAAQCLERYEQLIDTATNDSAQQSSTSTTSGSAPFTSSTTTSAPEQAPRRFRGEMEMNAEAKPARPDAVDMEEEEKEMLSEARARLANTKGKKAKRKIREKALEEAKRLAVLQKQRELRAAGIINEQQKHPTNASKQQIDYVSEIPFQRLPAPGMYDVSKENAQSDYIARTQATKPFIGKSLTDIDGERKDVIEERERQKDAKRRQLLRDTALPEAIASMLQRESAVKIARTDMNLPAPQVDELQMRQLTKDGTSLQQLQHEAEARSAQLRTPISQTDDLIRAQAQGLAAAIRTPAPLLGADTSSDAGATPMASRASNQQLQPLATPNVLLTPHRTHQIDDDSSAAGGLDATQVMAAQKLRRTKQVEAARRQELKSAFSVLPAPTNEYAVQPATDDGVINEAKQIDDSAMLEDDAEAIAKRADDARALAADQQWRIQSQAIQRALPRPTRVPDVAETVDRAQREIHQLVRRLVRHDNKRFPWSQLQQWRAIAAAQSESTVTDRDLTQAQELVVQQLCFDLIARLPTSMQQHASQLTPRLLRQLWKSVDVSVITDQILHQQFHPSPPTKHHLQQLETILADRVKATSKQEQREAIKLGGYAGRIKLLKSDVQQSYQQWHQAALDQIAAEHLARVEEEIAIPSRLRESAEQFEAVKARHASLQQQYAELSQRRQAFVAGKG